MVVCDAQVAIAIPWRALRCRGVAWPLNRNMLECLYKTMSVLLRQGFPGLNDGSVQAPAGET